MSKKNVLSAIRAANEKTVTDLTFDLPVGDQKISVTMKSPNPVEVSRATEFNKAVETAKARNKGLNQFPVDEEKWQEHKALYLEKANREQRRKIEKEMEAEKPRNLAEQVGIEAASYSSMIEVIPTLIYVDDERLFRSEDEMVIFSDMIKNLDVLKILYSKFAELMTLNKTAEEAVKNAPKPSSKN